MFNFMRLPPLRRLMLMKAITGGGSWSTISGNPVSFTAKAAPLKQLSVAFSPKQDLHGYENPWPAGGGANKWDEEWEVGAYNANGLPSAVTDRIRCKNYIPVTGGATYRYVSSHGTYWFVDFFDANKDPLQTTVAMNPINTAITAPANAAFMLFYTDAAYGTTYLNDIAINYPSSVTTYSPYSNECPILGWDSLTVEQRGVNLWNKANAEDGYVDDADGVIKGTAPYKNTGFIPVKPNTQYYVKTDQTGAAWGAWYDADKRYISGVAQYQLAPTITAPANAAYVNLTVCSSASGNLNTFGVNYPATVTEFVPYTGRSISITLGSTVYSGTVDVVTGQGDGDMDAADMGNLNWVRITTTTNPYFRFELPNRKDRTPIMCETYPVISFGSLSEFGSSADDNTIGYSALNKYIAVRADAYATASAFKTAVAGRKVAFKCAENIPFTTTPTEVSSLAGDNTMWSNANGDLSVTYRSN